MLKIGDKAPPINSIDENGEVITLDQFKGKKIFDIDNACASIKVIKGGAKPSDNHGVDAISGGTITSNGVTEMLDRTLKVYVPYLKNQN